MTHTTDAFDALMPEPAVRAVYATAKNTPAVKVGAEMSGYMKSPDYYTADQMRTAMQAVWDSANERAAKVWSQLPPSDRSGWQWVPKEPTPAMIEAAMQVKRERLKEALQQIRAGKDETEARAPVIKGEWDAMLAVATEELK